MGPSKSSVSLVAHIPIRLQRRGGRKLIITPEGVAAPARKPSRNETLVKALVRAHRWRRRLESGQARSIADLAEQEDVTAAKVCRCCRSPVWRPTLFERSSTGDSQDTFYKLRDLDPDVPAALNNRQADNWRPLLAIADTAGGDWPRRARDAALGLSAADEDAETIGVLSCAMARPRKPGPRSKSGRLSRAYTGDAATQAGVRCRRVRIMAAIRSSPPASGILLANGFLTRHQHTAALRYAWAHYHLWSALATGIPAWRAHRRRAARGTTHQGAREAREPGPANRYLSYRPPAQLLTPGHFRLATEICQRCLMAK